MSISRDVRALDRAACVVKPGVLLYTQLMLLPKSSFYDFQARRVSDGYLGHWL